MPPEKEKPEILVTIPPYAYIVNEIARERLSVLSVVPPATNLHVFEPTPREMERMSEATLWIRLGEPFERKILSTLRHNNPHLETIDLWRHTYLLESDTTACQHHHHDESKDLHYWMSPRIMLDHARLIADTLADQYPEDSDYFRQNFQELETTLEDLQEEMEGILAPFSGEAILVSHASMGYFCHDFDLIQLAVECEGKDPKPRDIQKLLREAVRYRVRSVLTQTGFNNKGAQQIAKKLDLPLYKIDPFAYDYPKNMLSIAQKISE